MFNLFFYNYYIGESLGDILLLNVQNILFLEKHAYEKAIFSALFKNTAYKSCKITLVMTKNIVSTISK